MFVAFARQAEVHISEFKAQEVTKVWTFETPCQWDVKSFAALTRAAQLCISEFNAQGIEGIGYKNSDSSCLARPLGT